MGLTEDTATALLALNGQDTEVGLAGSGQRLAVPVPSGSRVLSSLEGESSAVVDVWRREFAYGLAKKACGFQRDPVGRA